MTNIFDQLAEEIPTNRPSDAGEGTDLEPTTPEACETNVPCTSPELKQATQELLRHGYVEESARQDLFRRIVVNSDPINAVLEPLDLQLRIDTHRGVGFLAVSSAQTEGGVEEDAWNHPLVRRQRLTLEQSLLVAILRQNFALHEQEYGIGQSTAKVAVDEILATYVAYFGDSGSDSKNENRLLQILEQLKTHGLISEVDKNQEIIIRPLIAYMANPESLSALIAEFKQRRLASSGPEGHE